MCFQPDSSPPIAPVSGAFVDTSRLTLAATDGSEFSAFLAEGSGGGLQYSCFRM